MNAMFSEHLIALNNRVHELKIAFLPPLNPLGDYSSHEEDKMRSFRMLAHAEMEHYLEAVCDVFVSDLEGDIRNARRLSPAKRAWASKAVNEARIARSGNNGIKKNNILAMFEPFGFEESFFDAVSPVFLDRMATFGKDRGDVAHNSAMRAVYRLNSAREGAMAREIMGYLMRFDELMFTQRIRGMLID